MTVAIGGSLSCAAGEVALEVSAENEVLMTLPNG